MKKHFSRICVCVCVCIYIYIYIYPDVENMYIYSDVDILIEHVIR